MFQAPHLLLGNRDEEYEQDSNREREDSQSNFFS
jgi:hypothetical protein